MSDVTNSLSKFKVGQVVYLNSGSPALTVTTVKDDSVWVTWVDHTMTQHATYPAACLRSTDPIESGEL